MVLGRRRPGAVNRSDGPDEFRRAVREEIKRGAEIIKMFVTGGHGTVAPSEQTEMSRAELTAGIEAAHERGVLVRGHIANRDALHMALDAGIDVVDHGDGLDEAAIARMVEPGHLPRAEPAVPGPLRRDDGRGGRRGLGFTAAMAEDIERALAILPAANEAGVKLLCGDDYGAIGLPHGRYADELEFYVKEAGIAPLDVLRWATAQRRRASWAAPTSSARCARATWPTCSSSTATRSATSACCRTRPAWSPS